jgi:hypothetical protein
VSCDNTIPLTAYHEAGHVLIELACGFPPFQYVSALPNPALGDNNSGCICRPPRHEYKPKTKHDELGWLLDLIAGKMAERRHRANEILRRMGPPDIFTPHEASVFFVDVEDGGGAPTDKSDYDRAFWWTKKLHSQFAGQPGPVPFLERVELQTEAFLSEHWCRVETLAGALIDPPHTLTYPQVCQALNINPDRPAQAFAPFQERLQSDWPLAD